MQSEDLILTTVKQSSNLTCIKSQTNMFRAKYSIYNQHGQAVEKIAEQILEDYTTNRIGGIRWRGYQGGASALLNIRPYKSDKQDLIDIINVYRAIGHRDRDSSWLLLEDASYDSFGKLTGFVTLELHDSILTLTIQK